METSKSIEKRYAVRNYQSKQISEEQLTAILHAGYFTPVGMGRFDDVQITVVQNPAALKEIETVATKVLNSPHVNPTYNAPTLLVLSAKQGTPYPESIGYANVSVLAQTLMIEAADQGVGSTYLFSARAILDKNAAMRATLGIPDDFSPLIFVALGYPNDENKRVVTTEPRIATHFVR